MHKLARIARYVGIICIAGMALTTYFSPVESPFGFFVMLGFLVCFCLCIPIVVLDHVWESARGDKE